MREPVDFLPILTTVIAAVFAYVVLGRYRDKVRQGQPNRTHLLWWSIGLVTYGAGTFTEAYTTLFSWNTGMFKAWYVAGALLGGWPLAQGSVYLHLSRSRAHKLAIVTTAYVIFAAIAVVASPIDYSLVAPHDLSGRVIGWTWARLLSPLVNTYAAIFLIGGAIYSARYFFKYHRDDKRVLGNIAIAVGALLPGIGGGFSRAGHTEVLYVLEFIGLIFIYFGFRLNTAPSAAPFGAIAVGAGNDAGDPVAFTSSAGAQRISMAVPADQDVPISRSRQRPGDPSRVLVLMVIAAIVIIVGVLVGASAGPADLDFADSVSALFSTSDSTARTIVWDFRIPRVAISLMAGAALAVAGLLLQGTTRNPLGDPQLFGIGGGALIVQALAMGGIITVGLHLLAFASVAASVVAGGIIGLFVVRSQHSPAGLALIGISLAALTAAVASGILAGSRVVTQQSLFLIGGGTANRSWEDVLAILPYLAVGLAISGPVAKSLATLSLGDSVARTLGVEPRRVRRLALLSAGILGGVAVAAAGLVGFVGLLVPHAARQLVGNDTRALYAASIPLGAAFVLLADQFARLVISPSEIPIGMVTAIIGAPVMTYLVRRVA